MFPSKKFFPFIRDNQIIRLKDPELMMINDKGLHAFYFKVETNRPYLSKENCSPFTQMVIIKAANVMHLNSIFEFLLALIMKKLRK